VSGCAIAPPAARRRVETMQTNRRHQGFRCSVAAVSVIALFATVTDVADVAQTGAAVPGASHASIGGTVTSNGSPTLALGGICVTAFEDGSDVGGTATNKAGDYTISKLSPGSYKVEFLDCRSTLYLAQFYDDETVAGNDGVEATGTSFTVGPGQVVLGIDATMEKGGQFAGAVTTTPAKHEKAVGIAGICVEAAPVFDANDPDYDPPYEYATTNSKGHYTLSGLWNWGYDVTANECSPLNSGYGGASVADNPMNAFIGASFHLGPIRLPAA
jgi:hypothetical protein